MDKCVWIHNSLWQGVRNISHNYLIHINDDNVTHACNILEWNEPFVCLMRVMLYFSNDKSLYWQELTNVFLKKCVQEFKGPITVNYNYVLACVNFRTYATIVKIGLIKLLRKVPCPLYFTQ